MHSRLYYMMEHAVKDNIIDFEEFYEDDASIFDVAQHSPICSGIDYVAEPDNLEEDMSYVHDNIFGSLSKVEHGVLRIPPVAMEFYVDKVKWVPVETARKSFEELTSLYARLVNGNYVNGGAGDVLYHFKQELSIMRYNGAPSLEWAGSSFGDFVVTTLARPYLTIYDSFMVKALFIDHLATKPATVFSIIQIFDYHC